MNQAIVPIVEGQAEVESVPVLLRRIFGEKGTYSLQVAKPFRVKRNRIVRHGELERAVLQSVRSRPGVGGILVLIDADDDCPAQLGPKLLERCQSVTQLPAAVVLATRELECWFLGAKESLIGIRSIRPDATTPQDPESVRGAKERLNQNMQDRRYIEVDDQPALAACMNIQQARGRCPSFDRFLREVESMISQLIQD
ncbi:MAG: DUF4276 family protein [Candidatus Zixiibacteriota bacterium]